MEMVETMVSYYLANKPEDSDWVVLPVEASPWGLFGVANMFDFLEM
mgnify:CR=1 FL=1